MIEFTVSTTGIEAGIAAKRERIILLLKNRLNVIDLMLQSKAQAKLSGNPIKSHTSKLFNSVRALPVEQHGQFLTGQVQAGGGAAPYAKYLEHGTAAHVITAKNAKVLAFQVGGNTIFRKTVQHPGTRAYHFMANTLSENSARILEQLKAAVQQGAA